MLALVDANNMYVSCERVFAPRLRGRPVVVLSSNDGACIARSNEAKDLGVKMAQPWFEVRHLQRQGLLAVSANFELYGDMSQRMMAVEARYAPRQKVYSIDESFLDFEGVSGDLLAIGRDMRAAIWREVGLPSCVGFGPTKTLAKLANHVAKMAERKPGSYPAHLAQVCSFGAMSPEDLAALLDATPVGDVWGIGRRISGQLIASGIHTAGDLRRSDTATLRKQFNVTVEKTVLELRGTACLTVDDVVAPRQQILVSRSFGTPIHQLDGLIEAASEFAARAAEKLREQGSAAGSLSVFFATSPYRVNDRQHSASLTMPLVRPTADSRVLITAATEAVRQAWRPGVNYAKAGVILSDLQNAGAHQGELDLFSACEPAPVRDQPKLMAAMDALNRRFGRDAVRIGSQTLASSGQATRSWAVKQERRTPRCTTRWDEMPRVRC